jgi:hypothetical protein
MPTLAIAIRAGFHRLPPFGQISAGKSNIRVKANVPAAGKTFSLIAVIATPGRC